MKATELMIGDWVKIGDADKYHGYFGRVRAINSITGYCIVGAMIGEDIFTQTDVFIDDIEPIPLTPEILEKNGWKVDDMYAKLRLEDGKWLEYYYHESRLRKYWEGVDEWQNHAVVREITFQCHCSYVHELQHALRLCGLSEFADDFKI